MGLQNINVFDNEIVSLTQQINTELAKENANLDNLLFLIGAVTTYAQHQLSQIIRSEQETIKKQLDKLLEKNIEVQKNEITTGLNYLQAGAHLLKGAGIGGIAFTVFNWNVNIAGKSFKNSYAMFNGLSEAITGALRSFTDARRPADQVAAMPGNHQMETEKRVLQERAEYLRSILEEMKKALDGIRASVDSEKNYRSAVLRGLAP